MERDVIAVALFCLFSNKTDGYRYDLPGSQLHAFFITSYSIWPLKFNRSLAHAPCILSLLWPIAYLHKNTCTAIMIMDGRIAVHFVCLFWFEFSFRIFSSLFPWFFCCLSPLLFRCRAFSFFIIILIIITITKYYCYYSPNCAKCVRHFKMIHKLSKCSRQHIILFSILWHTFFLLPTERF